MDRVNNSNTNLMTKTQHKTTLLESEVQRILSLKGFSASFYKAAFLEFRKETRKEFNQAVAIAELFINQEDPAQSDFATYTF
jgi:hypothetical protein